ncbi:MAG: protein kinase [Pseudomonadota bacterium]
MKTRQEFTTTRDPKTAPDQPPAGALPQGTQLHEFKLLASLGEGGFSIVYAAHDTQLHRDVAIKEYMPASFASRSDTTQVSLRSERHRPTFEAGLRSFMDEARLLAQFKHSALVEVLRFWEQNGTAYMAMPRYSGKTMRLVLREHVTHCDEQWLRSIFAPILDVLELLHSRNVYHRDIAPDNILIQNDGTPVLLDLGSARRVLGDLQQALTVVVKPGYAPIEQYAEDLSVPQGPWTDIYAIGAVLYFAITGHAPAASVSRMMKDSLEPLAAKPREGYSTSFLKAVDHALALQPGDRPQSITELRALLDIPSDGNWQPIPLSELQPKSLQQQATEPVDDAKTVILSAQEIAQMAARLTSQAQGALHAAERTQQLPSPSATTALPDPFKAPAKQETAENSFADVQDLMSGQLSRQAGIVSVPRAPSSTEPASARPASGKVVAGSNRSLLIGVSAAALLALLIGTGLWFSRSDPAPATVAAAPTATAQNSATVEPTEPVKPDSAPAQADPLANQTTPPTVAEDPVETRALLAPPADVRPQSPPQPPQQLPPSDLAFETLSPPASETTAQTPPQVEPVRPPTPAVQPARDSAETRTERPVNTAETPAPRQPPAQTQQTQAAKPPVPAIAGGLVTLSIQPWGEVWVDGKQHGISPPLKQLELSLGNHKIELRSPGFPPLRRNLTLKADTPLSIVHDFQSATQTPAAEVETAAVPTKPTPATPPAAESTPPPKVSPPPAAGSTPATENKQPVTFEKGVLALSIAPWGEVWIDGKQYGVSPPLHELRLPEGEYRVELRNASFPTAVRQMRVTAKQRTTLQHSFQ